jgi:hypothetical protein
MKHLKPIFVFLFLSLCASCAKPYYGYSESDWNNLSEEAKKEAQAEYQDIINVKQDQPHEAIIDNRKQQIIHRGVGAQAN